MRDHRGVFPVDLMCRSRVGSSGFYAWLKHPEIPLHRDNLILLTELFTEELARTMAVLESILYEKSHSS